ncbi:hypothetical protein TREMEDRAFT_27647 [Tremella mesenterica DSM 1558]|uniref:uncharacterized protein n=1 Tax=Tremella mesenterica (strain ATCC 24925 / CBS 8224 / DSM 1558 / NBRC 9311 / NRRL Y-6157 / RJB 2259-6 / UBC 559-6) TaxID=578456 RepID=UPI0003F48F49|nr:uncharacterized protein TREMEDRAFT_27647 [Tremella mesenterica DSM 1558]EIW71549.1 hypothetical protein TREMEDRAFT_27647 [Tremella mesenterica DSM 1558]
MMKDLTSVPFASLLKAQRALRKTNKNDIISEPHTSSSKDKKVERIKARLATLQKTKGKAALVPLEARGSESPSGSGSEDGGSNLQDRIKRGNKHAPAAMSTKRQVSRIRKVVDVAKTERRDPRFSSVSAGRVDPHLHSKSYDFLPDLLKDEMAILRTALNTAVKAERNCPWSEKTIRTAERERIERDLGQLRTKMDRTQREARERQVLAEVKREEREKREKGKGAWYLKKSEKRDLLLKSRYEALEKEGGKGRVKKVLEKKRKKVAQKEKKSRPFAPSKKPRTA